MVGPLPDDRHARGPSRVSSLLHSMGIKHTHSMYSLASPVCSPGSARLAWRQTSEHRVERLPERRPGHVVVVGARDEQTAQPRVTPDEVNEDAGAETGTPAA